MKTSDFYYDLPQELIAQTPMEPRDMSRLMVIDKNTGEIEHKIFKDLIDYFLKAGIDKDVNLNTFRHSFAVHLLQNGANVRAVQKMLGNQVLTYMDTYYEIINSDKINFIYRNTHPRA